MQLRVHYSRTCSVDTIVLHSAALLAAAAFVLPSPDLMVTLFAPTDGVCSQFDASQHGLLFPDCVTTLVQQLNAHEVYWRCGRHLAARL